MNFTGKFQSLKKILPKNKATYKEKNVSICTIFNFFQTNTFIKIDVKPHLMIGWGGCMIGKPDQETQKVD